MATERLFAISATKKIVLCRNRKCKKYGKLKFTGRLIGYVLTWKFLDFVDEAKQNFICCNFCFTYYCSHSCVSEHANQHLTKCVYSKAVRNSAIIKVTFLLCSF